MSYILMNRRSQRYYREPMPLKSQEVITLFDATEKEKQQVDIRALGVTKIFTWFAYGDNYRVVVSESYKGEKLAKDPDNYEFIPVIKK